MSTLRTNSLEGVDAKNSITIVAGAGNVTTTSVQEGIAKYWTQFNGTSTVATVDSFNQGGLTDNGTGNYTISYTNNMNNNDFSVATGTKTHEEMVEAVATSTVQLLTMNSSGSNVDDAINCIIVHGDLA